jgi:hypothetical protein
MHVGCIMTGGSCPDFLRAIASGCIDLGCGFLICSVYSPTIAAVVIENMSFILMLARIVGSQSLDGTLEATMDVQEL